MRHRLLIIGLFIVQTLSAQYNIDRVLMAGRSALYYEDYVLSMQYFNQVISAGPSPISMNRGTSGPSPSITLTIMWERRVIAVRPSH